MPATGVDLRMMKVNSDGSSDFRPDAMLARRSPKRRGPTGKAAAFLAGKGQIGVFDKRASRLRANALHIFEGQVRDIVLLGEQITRQRGMQRQARLPPRLDNRAWSIGSVRHANLERLPCQSSFPTKMLTTKLLGKSGGNWVEGDRFFDREIELEALQERVRNGTRTPPTAQRRMGKTSFVRELLRWLLDHEAVISCGVSLPPPHPARVRVPATTTAAKNLVGVACNMLSASAQTGIEPP